jgi:Uma2 family endonuclease
MPPPASTKSLVRANPDVEEGIEYPSSDGKPMGETGIHVRVAVWYTWGALWLHFAKNPRVAVEANMFVYYVKGDPKRCVCPDVFVVKDVPEDPYRRSYRVWKEGKAPDLVIEITSKKTRKEDLNKKFDIYQDVLKIPEYFLFDPTEDYLDPSLRGYRLISGRYEEIAWELGALPSEVLGLHLQRHGLELRFFNPATRKLLPIGDDLDRELEAKARELEAKARELEVSTRELEATTRELGATTRELGATTRELGALREAHLQEQAMRLEIEREAEQLRREVEALRRRLPEASE